MQLAQYVIIVCGLLALVYGLVTSKQVLAADAGTARMQEISAAVQEGARAYLNRQYTTIGIVGVVILIILGLTLGLHVAIGFIIGAVLSAAAGYVGMNVSVRANVRTAQAPSRGWPPAWTSPSRPAPSPACWWSASACSASPATTSSCAAA